LPTHLPHKIEKKRRLQEIKYKCLEVYVFFSLLAIETWVFLGANFGHLVIKEKGAVKTTKVFV
jgi:hypothetical protein